MKSTLQHIALIALLFSCFVSVQAGTKTWNSLASPSGGSWATASNWIGGSAPVANDDVVITPTQNMNITGIPVLTINSLTVNGTGTNTVTYSGAVTTLTIAANGSVNIAAGNTLDVGLMRIGGTAGSFTTTGTGTLITATTGSVLPAGTSTTYVTYTFDLILNGASNQTLSAYANYNNVTINLQTSSLKALLGSSITVNGTLTLTKGIIDINTKTMTMGSTANITGASSNSYIYTNGTFIRNGVSSSATLFPIGTATSYTPLTLTNTTGTPNITATVKSTFTNAPYDATKVVNLEWYVKSSATSTADITYQFNTADFAASYNVSSASEVGVYKTFYTASSLGIASGSNPYTLTATGVGLSSTAIYNVIGNTGSVMNPNKDYLWNGSTSTDYAVATNWTPARNVTSSLDNLTFTPSSGATVSITNVTAQTINSLTVNGSGTVSMTGGTNTLTFQSGGSFNIAAGTTLNMGTVRMTLTDASLGTLTTTGTGALITAATTPLPSTAAGTGVTFTFDVTLNGTAVQSIPRSTFNNLTINNTTSGIAAGIGGGDCTVNGTLNLTRGILCCAGTTGVGTTRNLFLGSTATITGGSSTSWVYPAGGTFVRKGVGTTSLLYPIGTLSTYTPLTIKNNSGTPNITTKLKSTFTNAPADATKVVNLEWSVLSSVATTADITFQFNDADKPSAYNAGLASELGNFTTAYTTSSVGVPAGSNPYTVSKTGLSIPTSGSNLYVIGNTYAVALTTPSAPTINSITPGNGTLSIAYTEGNTGGSTITGYKYSTDGGVNFVSIATANPLVITTQSTSGTPALANGTSYNVQIKAVNAIGDGAASGTSSGTPRTVPGSPQNVVATAGNTRASIAFTAPLSDGGSAITGYTVTSSPGSFTGSGTTSPITVNGLTNTQAYTFTVTATNAAGTGSGTTSGSVTPDATANNINVSTSTSIGSLTLTPVSDVVVGNAALLTINAPTNINSLTIAGGGQVTNTSLLIASAITINSDGTNGTGTYNDNGGTTSVTLASVNQYLSSSRNWYMSSPVSGATQLPTVDSGTLTFYSYPESDGSQATGANGYAAGSVWNTVSGATTMTFGTGYIVKPGAATSTVTFSGTGLNTGNQTINGLTYTAANPKHGFNLIGNPYPSYLNVMPSINANTNLESTVWYRTRDNSNLYHCETVNTASGFGTNSSNTGRVTGYIPPMQGFWVRTTSAANGNPQSITLSNANRSHSTTVSQPGVGTVPTTSLKVPASRNQVYTVLGLNVSNGISGDETIIMFTPEASSGLDAYDSGKMSNGSINIPELFTVANNTELAINTMSDIPYDTDIALGFTTGKAGSFSITASMVSNFAEGTQILLKDNIDPLSPVITDLAKQSYTFNSETTASNTSRFTLIFKAPTVATEINSTENNVWISIRNGQIVVNGTANKATLEIFNAVGQKVISRILSGTNIQENRNLAVGAYLVKLTNEGKSITKKIIID